MTIASQLTYIDIRETIINENSEPLCVGVNSQNKEMNFPFSPLKFSNKEINFPFSPLKFSNKEINFPFPSLKSSILAGDVK